MPEDPWRRLDVFGGVGTIVVVALWWRWFPDLRDLDTFDEVLPTTRE